MEGEAELDRGKINGAIRRLKERKAMGVDGIPNEVWKYGGKDMKEWVWEICNGVRKGTGGMEGGGDNADSEKEEEGKSGRI